ncbi:TetR/AcrR family transcriptional regulator [Myxococcota bacterium]|nr:TetR/AcrR family transcriptional regulator [Myxococcota bacterium]
MNSEGRRGSRPNAERPRKATRPNPTDRRSTRGDASRERILDVASQVFAERGFAGAGVDHLAERSGIAKTAIYYHFGSKEGLLAAVAERTAAAWIEGISNSALQAGDDPAARLDRALAGMRALLEETPQILRLLQFLTLELADEKPEIRATLQAILARARAAIVTGLNDALGVELPRADEVAGVVLALLDGIALVLQVDPDSISLDDAFAELRRIIVFLVASRLDPELGRWFDHPDRGALRLEPAVEPSRFAPTRRTP